MCKASFCNDEAGIFPTEGVCIYNRCLAMDCNPFGPVGGAPVMVCSIGRKELLNTASFSYFLAACSVVSPTVPMGGCEKTAAATSSWQGLGSGRGSASALFGVALQLMMRTATPPLLLSLARRISFEKDPTCFGLQILAERERN